MESGPEEPGQVLLRTDPEQQMETTISSMVEKEIPASWEGDREVDEETVCLVNVVAAAKALLTSVDGLPESLVGKARLRRLAASELAAQRRRLEARQAGEDTTADTSNLPYLSAIVHTCQALADSA
eukprot:CAMPEP_0172927236 /NCGR_PEP_ID=MMETSP1075-20121228/217136_1 /TAXON_ID=2916 /ORGANISM="Ceratium fusus, Strain PA161109" /LENGTH=125 /DNA_ID=CAMNT_0013788461 /DNA_START=85 /DNA_END=458 /DNA_ORIENTATION=+